MQPFIISLRLTKKKPHMKEIKQTPDSSQIKSIGYDSETKVFEIVYKNNATYEYYDVAADLWEAAQSVPSIGKFVNEFIKPHKYKLISK